MTKKFNYTGTCIPERHYMVDTSAKIREIIGLIVEGEYFSINRPRQYGKSTTIFLLNRELKEREGYFPVKISFEGIGSEMYESAATFISGFLFKLRHLFSFNKLSGPVELIDRAAAIKDFERLGYLLSEIVEMLGERVVLIIDEVDKSCNNQLFLDFLAMLRSKYLLSREGEDLTFHSVILAGVHDVKTLKIKLRSDEKRNYNSPWNIAVDFNVELAFSAFEIESMLNQYCEERSVKMDIPSIAERLYHFTSGYPFLVSKLCYIIDSYLHNEPSDWTVFDVDRAVNHILREDNTNFDSLIKNLENNRELYQLVESLLLKGSQLEYNKDSRLVNLGTTYGIFKKGEKLAIHNRIYRDRIYNLMTFNLKLSSLIDSGIDSYSFAGQFTLADNELDFEKVLLRFQAFMKEQYSSKNDRFVEYNWRLLYLAFIKPIINGHGFDFKEAQISEERRLDVVITYYNRRYISELKIWEGPKRHEAGLQQLADYLERQGSDIGFLVIFDFRKEMDYKSEWVTVGGKRIFAVWV